MAASIREAAVIKRNYFYIDITTAVKEQSIIHMIGIENKDFLIKPKTRRIFLLLRYRDRSSYFDFLRFGHLRITCIWYESHDEK